MLPIVNNGVAWMEDKEDEDSATWIRNNNNTRTTTNNINNNTSVGLENQVENMGALSGLKALLEVDDDDWFATGDTSFHNHQDITGNSSFHNHQDITFSPPNIGDPTMENLLLNTVDSSSSFSPSSSVFNNLRASQVHYLMSPKDTLPWVLNVASNNPFEYGFDWGEKGFLEMQASRGLNREGGGILSSFNDLSPNNQMNAPSLCFETQFGAPPMFQLQDNTNSFVGFGEFDEDSGNSLFLNRPKLLRPLENLPPIGVPPTLIQKRAASRKNLADTGTNLGDLGAHRSQNLSGIDDDVRKKEMSEDNDRKRKSSIGDDVEDLSIDGTGLNYDSDEIIENNKKEEIGKNGGSSSNANSTVSGGDKKRKKRGLPAKNLMAERRRRKKLNDKLYMLRSVVPKISKGFNFGDAIEHLKELLQRIDGLHNEIESTPPGSSLTPAPTVQPLTPTPPTLHNRMKDELCPSSMPSPNGQPARVEVRAREGRAVNIHMFSERKPGLLLATIRALDNLGLDVQQAVISCFNGFALDIFQAEKCKEGQDVHPEQIKAVLLDSAGFHGMMQISSLLD